MTKKNTANADVLLVIDLQCGVCVQGDNRLHDLTNLLAMANQRINCKKITHLLISA